MDKEGLGIGQSSIAKGGDGGQRGTTYKVRERVAVLLSRYSVILRGWGLLLLGREW